MSAAHVTENSERYEANVRLSRIEYLLQHIHLRSRPRCLGLVLGNRCNIGCIHCYQAKNNDNLLASGEIGSALRREFAGLYPYLSTLRLQGGELFVIPGFTELLDDVEGMTSRPIISISTNGTLIDEYWAERIVKTPFQNVTVSIDAARPETFAKLRRGAHLETVLANTRRIQAWKEKTGSQFPQLDSFFVVMRSNFREIPMFLRIAREAGISSVSFQTVHINAQNSSRFPMLETDEAITSARDIRELHSVLREAMAEHRRSFRALRFSGMTSLFEQQGLDVRFLDEQIAGLYPNSEGLRGDDEAPAAELCPNPWTTLFVVENGDVHLCFLAEPIGNLYEEPLEHIWNSPRAVMKRSRMTNGRYMQSGCSKQWCSWREGSQQPAPDQTTRQTLLAEMRELFEKGSEYAPPSSPSTGSEIGSVRRLLASRDRRLAEITVLFAQLCETNQAIHDHGQAYIDELEARLRQPLLRAAFDLSQILERAKRTCHRMLSDW